MPSTQEVVGHHLDCFASADLEGTMSDYAADAVMLTSVGIFRGEVAIREFYSSTYPEFRQPGTTFSLGRALFDDELAFVLWEAETAANRYEAGTDTFFVRGGKIVAQTFGVRITPKQAPLAG